MIFNDDLIGEEKPVFILGMQRTGSKLFQQILNKSEELFVSPELNFLFRWRNCLANDLEKIKFLDKRQSKNYLEGILFTEKYRKRYLFTQELNHDALIKNIISSDKSKRKILEILLKAKAELRGKKQACYK